MKRLEFNWSDDPTINFMACFFIASVGAFGLFCVGAAIIGAYRAII